MRSINARGPWLRMGGSRDVPIVRQATASECGLACVAMLAQHLGVPTDLIALRRRHRVSLKGSTLAHVTDVCQALALSTRAIRCKVSELGKLRTPCILHWRFNHFVVLKAISVNGAVLHDPARGVVAVSLDDVGKSFTGVALEVTAAHAFRSARQPLQLRLSALISRDAAIAAKFLAGLILALICETLVLIAPFYLQIIIDQVLSKSDHQLLDTLALAFGVLLLVQIAANTMRQLTFQYLSHVTVFDITARVTRKLMKLPMRYFRDRELGDIQHRIQSLSRVQHFVVQSLPALLLDVLFVLLIVGLMTLYEPTLTALMVAMLALWCVWRTLILPLSLRLSSDIAQTESSVQTHLLETLRGIQSIKAGNSESRRESEWCNGFAAAINARIQAGNLQVADAAVRQLLFQGARLLAVYLLAQRALGAEISIGMISAFVAYLGMFTTRAGGIVDRVLEYKLLAVPLDRLADIVFSEEEPASAKRSCEPIRRIELRGAWFAYATGEQAVLRNCYAAIAENELTAIAGASGCGKSTLLELIARNESLSSGELLFDGQPAHHRHIKDLRAQMSMVFQSDRLLKGSVAENITLFDADIDMAWVRAVASQACIASDIEALPMGYETRIGDMGSSFSRGQVQRLLLARAFYRRPRILLLDEVTSGLDYPLEKRVVQSISRLKATRIVVTHSDLMLQAADTVLWLHQGTLLLSRPDPDVAIPNVPNPNRQGPL